MARLLNTAKSDESSHGGRRKRWNRQKQQKRNISYCNTKLLTPKIGINEQRKIVLKNNSSTLHYKSST